MIKEHATIDSVMHNINTLAFQIKLNPIPLLISLLYYTEFDIIIVRVPLSPQGARTATVRPPCGDRRGSVNFPRSIYGPAKFHGRREIWEQRAQHKGPRTACELCHGTREIVGAPCGTRTNFAKSAVFTRRTGPLVYM